MILVLKNRSVISSIVLAALIFVFLYEPSSSERWDVLLISVIMLIFGRSINFKSPILDKKREIQKNRKI
jgi:hypothetical protein